MERCLYFFERKTSLAFITSLEGNKVRFLIELAHWPVIATVNELFRSQLELYEIRRGGFSIVGLLLLDVEVAGVGWFSGIVHNVVERN